MATNGVQEGKILSITAGGTVASGSVQEVGSDLIGVAINAATSGQVYPLATEGVFEVAKLTGTAWSAGDKVWWSSGDAKAHAVFTGAYDAFLGVAVEAAAAGAAVGKVKLRGGAESDADLDELVAKSLFDANTILAANTDNTPAALTLTEQTVVGRLTGGNIKALSAAELLTLSAALPLAGGQMTGNITMAGAQTVDGRDLSADGTKLDGIEALADVTDTANVTAAGAVMKSLYDANTILAATADDTPLALTVGASSIVGRGAAGNIAALTPSQARVVVAAASEAEGDELLGADTVGEDRLAANQITGRAIANAASGNAVGAIPVIHVLTLPAAAGDTNITLTHKTRIYFVTAIKTVQAGLAGGTLTVKNGASAITNAMTWDNTILDKGTVSNGQIDDAFHDIAAGGTLRVTTSAAQSDGIVYVFGLRVA